MRVCRRVDAADSEGSFRTSSSGGCDGDCSSSSVVERLAADSSTHRKLSSASNNNITSPDVTSSSRRCHGNGDACSGFGDWHSQRWRHWQQMTIINSCETNEQQTLVWRHFRSYRHAEIHLQWTTVFRYKTGLESVTRQEERSHGRVAPNLCTAVPQNLTNTILSAIILWYA